MTTPHNNAKDGAFAKSVLMPGDPLRAKYIAETYLEDAVLVNNVRGINGYTGTYKGKPVSVMASGMGMPTTGIYSYELFKFYGVDNIIRVGSTGAYSPDLHVFDTILVTSAYSESSYAKVQSGYESDTTYPSEELNTKMRKAAEEAGIRLVEGCTHSSDLFYHENDDFMEGVNAHNCLCVEMESFGLYANAKLLGKNAATILTVSDSLVTHEETTPEQREKGLNDMIRVALEAAIAD